MRLFSVFFIVVLSVFTGCDQPKNEAGGEQQELSDTSYSSPAGSFYFVAQFEGKNALYSHPLEGGENEIIWSSRTESVVEVLYSPDMRRLYFITSPDYGKRGVFSYFSKLKLYFMETAADKKVTQLVQPGDCVNYRLFFENEDMLKLEINMFADNEHKSVKHTEWVFDAAGKNLEKKDNIVDITVEGFPQLGKPPIDFVSADGKYSLAINKEEMVVVKELSQRGYDEIIKADKPLSRIGFSATNDKVVFTKVDVSPSNETLYDESPQTSELIVYSILNKKIGMHVKGSGLKNFIIMGDILIYDDGFGPKSEIAVINLKTLKELKRFSVKGGAGLFNIPTIPNYEA
ncbi:MAG: hypothetical protein HUU54_09690 [Ignavibacteriaceae bacterium]|nr:hypothetical protein [Ignavibacteriaceae bacterium]